MYRILKEVITETPGGRSKLQMQPRAKYVCVAEGWFLTGKSYLGEVLNHAGNAGVDSGKDINQMESSKTHPG